MNKMSTREKEALTKALEEWRLNALSVFGEGLTKRERMNHHAAMRERHHYAVVR